MKRILTFIVLIASMLAQLSLAAPPYIEGEVAVYANPIEITSHNVKKYLPNAGISVIKVETGKEWGMVQKLRAKGKRAGLNLIATKSAVPNDQFYTETNFQWNLGKVQAETAWEITTGAAVNVAVLDTGLAVVGAIDGIGCVISGYDVVNSDNEPHDGDGHGTHVSGTIAQATNNGTGVAGLAYGSCVMPVKVLGDDGSGNFADIADGIYFAVDNGAQVINMSLGTNARLKLTSDPIMDPALEYAYTNGVTVVAASGNDGNRRNVSYPAIHPRTIAVGATGLDNEVTGYSNKGTGLDIVAPGGNLSQDLNDDGWKDGILQETFINNAWNYYFFEGTSMASPHVSAAAAMLIAAGTATTPDEVKSSLISYALDLGDAGYDKVSGHGLLQIHNSLTESGSDGTPPVEPPPEEEPADPFCERRPTHPKCR